MSRPLLEVCVADAESLAAAIAGGADRIELCSALELGGLTPSPGLMALAALAPIPVFAMVRPRTGDFVYEAADIDAMLRDIDAIRAAGLAGVVLGASLADDRLDTGLLDRLRRHAGGLGATLHRAIDLVPDFAEATAAAVELGFDRILTSGGAATAPEGIANIATIHATAGGRLAVMAGSGITPGNIADLLAAVPVEDVHSSCARSFAVASTGAVRLGFAASARRRTDREIVAALLQVLWANAEA